MLLQAQTGTDPLAVYGAIVSTIALVMASAAVIRQFIMDRRKIIQAITRVQGITTPTFDVSITNEGRSIKIVSAGFLDEKGNEYEESATPHLLEDRHSFPWRFNPGKYRGVMKHRGGGERETRAAYVYVRDSQGKQFKKKIPRNIIRAIEQELYGNHSDG